MNIDTDRFKTFINNSFPAYKIEIKEFKSGVIVIDIFGPGILSRSNTMANPTSAYLLFPVMVKQPAMAC